MTSLSPEYYGDGMSRSMAHSAVAEAEFEGWAHLAESMMAEAVLVSLSDVQEPQARAGIVAECADAELALSQLWFKAVRGLPASPTLSAAAQPSSSPPVPPETATADALQAAEGRLAGVQAQLLERRTELHVLETRIEDGQRELDVLSQKQSAARVAIGELDNDVRVISSTLEHLRAERTQEEQAKVVLGQDMASLREARAAVARELDEVRAAMRSRAVEETTDLAAAVHTLVEALEGSQAREAALAAQLERARDAERVARAALDDMADTRKGAIAQLEVELVHKQGELRELESHLAAAAETKARLAEEEAATRGALASMSVQQTEQEAMYAALQQDTVALQEERADIVENVEHLRQLLDDLRAQAQAAATALRVSDAPQDVSDLPAALWRLIEACREKERQAAADRAAALEKLAAYESTLAGVAPLPEPLARGRGPQVSAATAEGDAPLGMAHDEDADDGLPVAAPTPQYQRVLPQAAVNPVTASLLRVKAQARELRDPSLGRLTDAIASPARRPDGRVADGSVQTPRPAHQAARSAVAPAAATTGGVPLSARSPAVGQTPTLSRVLYYAQRTPRTQWSPQPTGGGADEPEESRSRATHASSLHSADQSTSVPAWGADAANGSSSSWKAKMHELQSELRGLRYDLGTTK